MGQATWGDSNFRNCWGVLEGLGGSVGALPNPKERPRPQKTEPTAGAGRPAYLTLWLHPSPL